MYPVFDKERATKTRRERLDADARRSEVKHSISYAVFALDDSCRYSGGGASPSSGAMSFSALNGSRAAGTTTQGEIVVANDLPLNGPSGTISND